MNLKIAPAGDGALVADFGNVIDEKTNDEVHALADSIAAAGIDGVVELLPTFRSLMVFYDPSVILYEPLRVRIEDLAASSGSAAGVHSAGKKILEVPCLYGGSAGPDLESMETITGLSQEEIIRIHSGTDYKIYMLGFLPGFVYLGGLDPRIAAPRLDSPRTSIPAGSVGIGGSQTGVYPIASPGGWRLIGSTPLKFYDPASENPILCHAGEYIRFVPVTEKEYEEIRHAVDAGEYQPRCIEQQAG